MAVFFLINLKFIYLSRLLKHTDINHETTNNFSIIHNKY